jgi:hypothetical protein
MRTRNDKLKMYLSILNFLGVISAFAENYFFCLVIKLSNLLQFKANKQTCKWIKFISQLLLYFLKLHFLVKFIQIVNQVHTDCVKI